MISLRALPWKSAKALAPLDKKERLLKSSHRHAVRYLMPAAFHIALLSGVAVMFLFFTALSAPVPGLARATFLIGLVAVFGLEHWFFHWILSESTYDIILTDMRVLYITHYFWFHDSVYEIALTDLRAVEFKKHGFLQYLLDYGDIWFDTGGSDTHASGQTISFVPHPERWVDAIADAKRLRSVV